MAFWRRIVAALAIGVASFALDASAAHVTPMVLELDETGTQSSSRIQVGNTGDRQLPVELRVFSAEINEYGQPDFTPADEDFLVFPPQAVIEAGSQQAFRVQYLGSEPLDTSKIYYVSVRQVPVDLDPTISQVQIVTTFNVLVNVVPEGTEANISIDWAKPAEKNGLPGVEVRLVNDGDRYFSAGSTGWRLTGKSSDGEALTKVYRGNSAGEQIGYGVVPPGKARIFFVPTDAPFAEVTNIEIDR